MKLSLTVKTLAQLKDLEHFVGEVCCKVFEIERFGALCGRGFVVKFLKLSILSVEVFRLDLSFKISTEGLLSVSLIFFPYFVENSRKTYAVYQIFFV